ncbi:MAG: phosphoglycerate kinase [Candidatus Woesearchaeota archaeon]
MEINLKTLKDVDVKDKIVMLRTDYNVPIIDGVIVNDFRIRESLPTIKYLLNNQVKRIIIISHLKEPKGYDPSLSLKIVHEKLQEILNMKIDFLDLEKLIEMKERIVLLENIRFWKEKENDEELAKYLSSFADIYVFDAFSVAHRKHTTTHALMKFLPSYAGFLVEKEVTNLLKIFNSEKPLIAILGGAKISTKLGTIKSLYSLADKIILGGAMVFTILKAMNIEIGKSLYEPELVEKIMQDYYKIKDKLILPVDYVVAYNEFSEPHISNTIQENEIGYDIGPKTLDLIKNIINEAKTVVWNGPMGLFENQKFENGTKELVKILENFNGIKIVGGGETVDAIEKWSSFDKFTHVSTAGGAMLQFIENPFLPGLEGLIKR